ncbi:MAG: DMT family transporter, partial [Pseudomonadota bacterium]
MDQRPKTMNAEEWGLLILLSVLWGGAFFFVGVAVKELPPLTIVLARVAMAAAMLLPLFWAFGHRLPKTFAGWTPFFVMGLLNNVFPFSLLFAGQTIVTVGLASIINAMTPLFTVLVMAGFNEEKLTASRITGVLLGVAGVAILQGFDGSFDPEQTLGIALCLGGALSYGFAALWGRRYLGGVAPIKSATCQLICSSMVMVVVVALVDQPWTLSMPGQATWLSLIGLALFGTAIAYIVFFRILVTAGASNVNLVTLLIPVTALILANLYLDEPIRLRDVAGALTIGLGLLFI